MKHTVVSIKDRAIDSYLRPWMAPAPGGAVRNFTDEANREDNGNPLWTHPEDYDLYHLADFDDQSGEFTNIKPPVQLARGKEVRIGAPQRGAMFNDPKALTRVA